MSGTIMTTAATVRARWSRLRSHCRPWLPVRKNEHTHSTFLSDFIDLTKANTETAAIGTLRIVKRRALIVFLCVFGFWQKQEASSVSARRTVSAARRTRCEGTGTVAQWFTAPISGAFTLLRSGFYQSYRLRRRRRRRSRGRHRHHLPLRPRRLDATSLLTGRSRH